MSVMSVMSVIGVIPPGYHVPVEITYLADYDREKEAREWSVHLARRTDALLSGSSVRIVDRRTGARVPGKFKAAEDLAYRIIRAENAAELIEQFVASQDEVLTLESIRANS